jgi:hypothetical protein
MEEPSNDGKVQTPVVHDACPVCKSKVRIGEKLLQELRDAGLIHKDSFTAGLQHQVPLLDPLHPPVVLGPTVKIRVLLISWDCCECGIMYNTKFDVVEQVVPVQMQRGAPPPHMSNFPRLRG